MTDSLSVAVYAFASRMLVSVSVGETLLQIEGELVYYFQRITIFCGDVGSLIKAHIFRLVCVDMEAYACICSFHTM